MIIRATNATHMKPWRYGTEVDTDACLTVLRNSQLFSDLTDEELEKVAVLCREVKFEPGQIILNEGDTPDKIYIVEHGRVAIDMGLPFNAHLRRQATIEIAARGQAVGWSAVTGTDPFSATARSLDKTVALAIDGDGLRRLFEQDSSIGFRVQRRTIDLVRSRLGNARHTLAHILSIVAHDLKAPLHAVQSYHQVILGGYAGDVGSKQKDMLVRSGDRILGLLGLIDDLLDLSRIDSAELQTEPCSMPQIIEASLENVKPQAAQKELKLSCDWPEVLPRVMAHPARMQQVMTNLLSNAVKFTPKGGEIKVRVSAGREKLMVEVMDTGSGISEEDLPRIFGEFYQGQNAMPGGMGLGLAIAKKIVEGHGGKIWVESPYPESVNGTKFTFTLPVLAGTASDAEAKGDSVESRN